MTSGSGTRPFTGAVIADTYNPGATNKDSWVGYLQSQLMPGTANAAQHIQMEQSVNNNWPTPKVREDPFVPNIINNTVNLRLDCGTGQSFASPDSPNPCETAVDILQNGAPFQNGIVFGVNALNTGGGRVAPAIAMPPNVGFIWYTAANAPSAAISSDALGNINFRAGSKHERIGADGLSIDALGKGVGLQTVTTLQVCTPANAAFASCSIAVNFLTPEPDTAYGYSCTINAANAFLGSVSNLTTSGLTLNILATGTASPIVSGASCTITHP